MDGIFEPNLGVSKEELQELHDFAENRRKEIVAGRVEQEKIIEEKRQAIEQFGAGFSQAFGAMKTDERYSEALPDGKFLVVQKMRDRLRMAITSDGDQGMDGYLPNLDIIEKFQESTFQYSSKPELQSVFTWDRGKLDQYKRNTGTYWEIAEEIPIKELKNLPPDQLVKSFGHIETAIKLPPKLLEPQK